MNSTEDWKSLWPIGHVFSPPLLLSGSSAKSLGPLLFTPSPKTLTLLFSSPSLCPPIHPPRSLSILESLHSITQPSKDTYIPPSVISSIALDNDFGSQSDADITPLFNNNLQMLRCPDGEFLLLFPTGENFDRVGFVVVSTKEPTWKVNLNADGNIFTTPNGLNHRILRMSATASVTELSSWDLLSPSAAGDSIVVGLLFACTMYTVHWFSVEVNNSGSKRGRPVLVHLGMKEFHSSIVNACWSPHLDEENIVLLENGGLFLFDLGSYSGSSNFADELKGTRIRISWKDFGVDLDTEWVSCGFAWHPRILIVANSKSVFLVDVRYEESSVSVLAEIETFDLNNSRGTDRFVAFSMAGSGGFHFTVVSKCWLFLFDIRKSLVPVLQWAHGLDNPRYVNVFSLSDLRQKLVDDKYTWASESGFAILLGSFWSCEFGLFCYGPSVQALDGPMTPKISKFCNSLYAWELPSELSLSGRQCHCGDCLLKEDFWKTNLPSWIDWQQKKEIVMGFCILGKDLLAPVPEREFANGFTLIRLMSSGKLEIQTYNSLFDSPSAKSEAGEGMLLQSEDCLLYHSSDQKYKFPRKFKYWKLDYLFAYLNCNLVDLLTKKIRNPGIDPTEAIPYDQDCNKLPCDQLKAAGVDPKGSLLMTAQIFSTISLPMSIHEIALRRLWTGLPVDLLQLAVPDQSELLEVLTELKKVSSTLLDVPNLSQFPSFLFRKPLNHNNKSLHKVHHGDAVLGPSLPLPVLLTLDAIYKKKSCSDLEEEASGYSAKTEISHQCNEIIKVANNVALIGSHSVVNDSYVVSLSNDTDEAWVDSQKLKQPKCFFSYRPQAFSDNNGSTMRCAQDEPVFEEEKYTTFIYKMQEEIAPELNRDSKMHEFPNSSNKQNGLEMFDELCPVELKFDVSPMNFEVTEMKGYKLLKRQFSKWQAGFKPYQDYCSQFKLQKHVP
ncbi:uncharacterized protein LOC122671630 [Telopea speciosissima]|uniref:uncharacterized protein LOC122671630 n=1 Tax=Telopea speciosissima TaxID=54955 RepID=UPI001CC3623D|nr:uncharacterized protein LOC122671630 [Telopea speciosissima]